MSFLPKWEAIDFCLYPYITQSSYCPSPNPLKRSCILDTQNQYISYIILSVWLEHLEFWTDLLLFFKRWRCECTQKLQQNDYQSSHQHWNYNFPCGLITKVLQFTFPSRISKSKNSSGLSMEERIWDIDSCLLSHSKRQNLHKHMGNLSNTIWKAHAFICKMLIY